MNKEEIYDDQISPLMTQIIAICREHGIAMLASYSIPNGEDDGLCCTTHLADENGEIYERFAKANGIIRQGHGARSPLMLTTEHADGSKTLTAIVG